MKVFDSVEEKIDLEQMVKENNAIRSKLDEKLYATIPRLLDYIFGELTKTYPEAIISGRYPYNDTHNNKRVVFTERYVIREDGIYRSILDASADVMDPGESGGTKISKEGFLDWIRKDDTRALDVYNHIIKYLDLVKSIKTSPQPTPEERTELAMKYV